MERAWRVIQQNGRSSKSEAVRLELERFAEDAPRNIRSLKGQLSGGRFKFQKAKGVPIPKLDAKGTPTGKIRPIVLAPVESRIVQRAVLNVLVEIEALKPYVKTPYSFGGIRSNRERSGQVRGDELSAVPAAIKAVLHEIGQGRVFFASADIRAFFTPISKPYVMQVIQHAVDGDQEFCEFLLSAITVELDNIALLKEKVSEFPTEEIGVAQGNSLSPLLGNIALAKFDELMNEGDCRCIRYIDDFIILAPTRRAATARLTKATALLSEMKMELSPEKSSKGGAPVSEGVEFLGITIYPGLIRPSDKAQARFIESVAKTLADSQKAMLSMKNGGALLHRDRSLIATLKRVDGMIDGWGKHYWFCNDGQTFQGIDQRIAERISGYLGCYRAVREDVPATTKMQVLGLSELARLQREPFAYPKSRE
ncbi:reverse transcriptase domain-containing protein [Sphingomonas sp. PAMC 26617]|uniref:reverse transcriptase domain-containing protein n=1 Tax=Sphingomonas sp. PAMC 26617 TaxID=1112216 RepID=UPI0018DED561|nr:reverse transcriptase domain-containing protein [Sphingomonas sp. PAMC 26617]